MQEEKELGEGKENDKEGREGEEGGIRRREKLGVEREEASEGGKSLDRTAGRNWRVT